MSWLISSAQSARATCGSHTAAAKAALKTSLTSIEHPPHEMLAMTGRPRTVAAGMERSFFNGMALESATCVGLVITAKFPEIDPDSIQRE
jgi:hypothetical protein